MRKNFEAQLQQLNNDLICMGALCESAIASATKSLLTADKDLAKQAIAEDREIDQMEKDIESLCLKLLLQQQPVAKDLRLISAALKMITDMERIGDQAADIAEIVTFTDLRESQNSVHIADMSYATMKMVTNSIDAFVQHDLNLAKAVIESDDIVDNLFCSIKSDIIELILKDPQKSEEAVDIIMIAKYFERIGDHATNIAEWVAFSITGNHKEL